MRTEPPDIDRTALAHLLEREWAFRATSLEYLPVGFGSHHWEASDGRGERRFVTADRLTNSRAGADQDAAFAAFERAFRTAAVLRDAAGLEFVVGPLADSTGAVSRRLGDYAVTVFPFVHGEPPEEPAPILPVLGRLHAATDELPLDLVRREDFAIPHRDTLLDGLDRPWTSGPFGEPARKLLRWSADSLARRLEAYDELAGEIWRTSGTWVVTHGEPHSRNVIDDGRGGLLLVDWDTVCLAPRERDLWMVLDPDASGWSDYLSTAGECALDHDAMHLYRGRWDLGDIAAFVHLFRRPHEEAEDTIEAFGYLDGYLGKTGSREDA